MAAAQTVAEYKAALGSKFLHGEDFLVDGRWREVRVTIKAVHEPETIKGGDKKPVKDWVLAIEKSDKLICLNKTNLRLIKLALGTDRLKEWIGKQITLYAVSGSWFGEENVLSIRVRVPVGSPVPMGIRKHLGEDLTQDKAPPPSKRESEPGSGSESVSSGGEASATRKDAGTEPGSLPLEESEEDPPPPEAEGPAIEDLADENAPDIPF